MSKNMPQKDTILDQLAKYADKEDSKLVEGALAFSYNDQLFAIYYPTKRPVRLSLRCDPVLAINLRDLYESIMPGQQLSAKDWNTLIVTSQLSDELISDLIRHAFELTRQNSLRI